MNLFEQFPTFVRLLRERNIPFAVAGGFAAGLYRAEPRVTMDVDLAMALDRDAEQVAREMFQELGLKCGILRAADFAGGPLFAIRNKSTPAVMLAGRVPGESNGGVDLLLPSIPWVRPAVARARDHLADFGFGAIPVLRIEDVLLAKLYALQGKSRPKDVDDLQSILESGREFNRIYLRQAARDYGLKVPTAVRDWIPEELRILLREKG